MGHRDPRGGETVGDLERSPSGSSRSTATIILLPSYSVSCSRPAGNFSSSATTSTANVAARASIAALSFQASFFESRLSLSSKTMRPRQGPRRRRSRRGCRPCAAALGDLAPGVAGARRGPRRSADRGIDALLEAEALAGAGLLGLGELDLVLTLVEHPRHLLRISATWPCIALASLVWVSRSRSTSARWRSSASSIAFPSRAWTATRGFDASSAVSSFAAPASARACRWRRSRGSAPGRSRFARRRRRCRAAAQAPRRRPSGFRAAPRRAAEA